MKVRLCVAIAAAVYLSGCATLGEDALERREYRNADYHHQFTEFRHNCTQKRKRIVIQAQARLDRRGIPRPGDHYFCV